jgi:hypothetical protein
LSVDTSWIPKQFPRRERPGTQSAAKAIASVVAQTAASYRRDFALVPSAKTTVGPTTNA